MRSTFHTPNNKFLAISSLYLFRPCPSHLINKHNLIFYFCEFFGRDQQQQQTRNVAKALKVAAKIYSNGETMQKIAVKVSPGGWTAYILVMVFVELRSVGFAKLFGLFESLECFKFIRFGYGPNDSKI